LYIHITLIYYIANKKFQMFTISICFTWQYINVKQIIIKVLSYLLSGHIWKKITLSIILMTIFIKLNIYWFLFNNIFLIFKTIKPTDYEIINFFTMGERCHNYHHVFPWDYRSADISNINYTTSRIDWSLILLTLSRLCSLNEHNINLSNNIKINNYINIYYWTLKYLIF